MNRNNVVYVPYREEVNIKEIKAPTDESVKLLNEMQTKSTNNIVYAIKVNENHLQATVVGVKTSMLDVVFYARFILNGKEYFIEEQMNFVDFMEYKRGSFYKERLSKLIHKKLSEAITTELLSNCEHNFKDLLSV